MQHLVGSCGQHPGLECKYQFMCCSRMFADTGLHPATVPGARLLAFICRIYPHCETCSPGALQSRAHQEGPGHMDIRDSSASLHSNIKRGGCVSQSDTRPFMSCASSPLAGSHAVATAAGLPLILLSSHVVTALNLSPR